MNRIIVNGETRYLSFAELSYDDIARLADVRPVPGITITYRKGPAENPEGSLLEGQTVKLQEGMIFNARLTNNA